MQSLNPYTYGLNNPFKYHDPSGHFFLPFVLLLAKAGLTTIITHAITPVLASFAVSAFGLSATASFVFSNAIIGGLTGLISSKANLQSAFGGLVFGGLMGGIDVKFGSLFTPKRILLEGISGGISNKIQGGSFADGFLTTSIASIGMAVYQSFPGKHRPDGLPRGEYFKGNEKGLNDPPDFYHNNVGEQGPVNTNTRFSKLKYNILHEVGVMSRLVNLIPGANNFAFLHDHLQIRWNKYLNWNLFGVSPRTD
ncbi:unnamed protein product [Brachionus calyciflorus]|uniref:RHS repeat-associated core domain-containing protein n=1 Tax=Brachionus calyciflorus TaxID=104777 RepID=A0A814IIV9_9BILA|nr:unnamed protein product [Brachionus calyciflorus]